LQLKEYYFLIRVLPATPAKPLSTLLPLTWGGGGRFNTTLIATWYKIAVSLYLPLYEAFKGTKPLRASLSKFYKNFKKLSF